MGFPAGMRGILLLSSLRLKVAYWIFFQNLNPLHLPVELRRLGINRRQHTPDRTGVGTG